MPHAEVEPALEPCHRRRNLWADDHVQDIGALCILGPAQRGAVLLHVVESMPTHAIPVEMQFEASAYRRLVAEHRAGAAQHGDRLWLLMNLEIWQRVFLDGDEPAPVAA